MSREWTHAALSVAVVVAWFATPLRHAFPGPLLVGFVAAPLLVFRTALAHRVLVAVLANLLLVPAVAALGYATTTLMGSWTLLCSGALVAIWISVPPHFLAPKNAKGPRRVATTGTVEDDAPDEPIVIITKALVLLAAIPIFAFLFSPWHLGFPGIALVAAFFGIRKMWPLFLNGDWTNYVAAVNATVYPVWVVALWSGAAATDRMYYFGGLTVLLVLSTAVFVFAVAERRRRETEALRLAEAQRQDGKCRDS